MPTAARAAEALAAAAVFSLPWSTSVTSVLIACWLIAALLTLDASSAPLLQHPALALPVALCLLAATGVLWADVAWPERLRGFGPFLKLLVIPLLMVQFSRSGHGLRVVSTYLVSAILLLAYSWVSLAWPGLAIVPDFPGVPVKDPIYQSICFVLAIAALFHLAITALERRRTDYAATCVILAVAFLVNIAYVATSRTALVILPILLLVISYQRLGTRGAVLAAVALGLIGTLVWATSPYLRERVAAAVDGTLASRRATATSVTIRIGFWHASLDALSEAPVIGHGTGSIRRVLDESARQGRRPPDDLGIRNPHNQILAVGIQLGAIGIAVLLAMWLAHMRLFWGDGWPAWLGLLVVVQNVIASLFNSHLSDFTAGWLYVFGVGILGGTVLRQEGRAPPPRPACGAQAADAHPPK